MQIRAQLRLIDLDRAQKDERLAFLRIDDRGHCERTVAFISKLKGGENFLFDRFVRNHLAANF